MSRGVWYASNMKLNRDELKAACYAVATNTMWEQRPVDVKSIQAVAANFVKIAEFHEEFVVEQGRDPNLIVRAVRYLDHVHAMPPMRDDTRWFDDMLQVLIELACPNTGASRELEAFFRISKKESLSLGVTTQIHDGRKVRFIVTVVARNPTGIQRLRPW